MDTFLLLDSNKPCNQYEDTLRSKPDKPRAFYDSSNHIKSYHNVGGQCRPRTAFIKVQSAILSNKLTTITNKCKVRLFYEIYFYAHIYAIISNPYITACFYFLLKIN